MSAVPSPPTLRARLETFECHFTWNLNSHRNHLFLLRDKLEDIGTEDGNLWLGHIYNLQAYVHFLLASEEQTPGSTMSDALRCFGQAGEAFRQVRNPVADDGPRLLVNYGNLAWLHYHREEWSESVAYLGKAEALLREYPSSIQGQPHQEVLAEKAWTLMNFGQEGKRAVELFRKAIEMEPAGPVEWTTSHALALAMSSPRDDLSPEQEADVLETLRRAVKGDPDNLYIAVMYLGRRAMTDSRGIAERACELTKEVLKRSQTSYSGIRPLLRVYRLHVSFDEAIEVAKKALERDPTKRHLKYCLANCYKWKIFSGRDSPLIEDLRSRAIGLYEELCSLYPHSFLMGRITLASLYAQSRNPDNMEADKIFRDLLEIDLEPAQRQILYNKYAKFLHFSLQDRRRSIDYLMKAAEILHSSRFRRESIHILTQIKNSRMDRMSGEIEDFLAQLTLYAVPSPPTLRARLETFECHFTWNLNSHRNHLFLLRDKLEDIGTEDGNLWLGHIYNLQAYVHFLLASEEQTPGSTMSDALRCFGQAGEAFRQVRNTVADEGPWLLVNYGNLAWLHYRRDEWSESLAYLGKAEALLREYPSSIQGQPHQEVLAEKAWTLMNFGQDGKRSAVELFRKAIEVEPACPVEWTTSHALALAFSSPPDDSSPEQEADVLETLRRAVEGDPDNLYVATVCLERRAMTDSRGIAERARELTKEVLKRSQTSYSGIRPLLRVYRLHVSLDEAIDVANEALERHPTKRHLKFGLASCYKWKMFSDGDSPLIEGLRRRAISLYEELCSLYPHSFLLEKIALASLYAQSNNHDNMEADKIYKELLEIDLEPAQQQILYNKYAKFLNFILQDRQGSIEYHMMAAEILHSSWFRRNSIHILTQIKNRRMNRMCGEIEDFLAQLPL
ncbi:uncharacterized protein LOC115555868 [Gadus morhua]|uniref:uncharacterized protein LOC115555868 n=1 Tax=Gadus morhua TaxID=8049 RepID=UPI0011B6B105|nr:uncharacterized protein LOC115555868 [Gadus morhua]